jgi:hypothetical protein
VLGSSLASLARSFVCSFVDSVFGWVSERSACTVVQHILDVCRSCTGYRQPAAATACISLDCTVFFERCKSLRTTQHVFTVLQDAGWLVPRSAAQQEPPQRAQPDVVEILSDDD